MLQEGRFFEAADPALVHWLDQHAGTVVHCLLAQADADFVPELQACCCDRRIQLYGALFPSLIVDDTIQSHGLWLGISPTGAVSVLIPLKPDISAEAQAGQIAATLHPYLAQWPSGSPTLFLTLDGTQPRIGSLCDALYLQLSDRVNYAGTCAGTDRFEVTPCLFDQDRFIAHGAWCCLLPGQRFGLLHHGYRLREQTMLVTSSTGNCITQIDWRPAFEVYRALAEPRLGRPVGPEEVLKVGVCFPFGLARLHHEPVLRIPVRVDEQGGLHCIGEVPEHAVLALLEAPDSPERSATTLASRLREGHPVESHFDVTLFYCMGRSLSFGSQVEKELALLRRESGAHHLVGALSLGEISSADRHHFPVFHNGAILCDRQEAE